jgi:hypothetical protein
MSPAPSCVDPLRGARGAHTWPTATSSSTSDRTRDEISQLSAALKDMNTSLISIVSEVRKGADSIGTASAEIAAGNLDLSVAPSARPARWKKPRPRWRS